MIQQGMLETREQWWLLSQGVLSTCEKGENPRTETIITKTQQNQAGETHMQGHGVTENFKGKR